MRSMKKIFILLGIIISINVWSQTPTYKWKGGAQETLAGPNLVKTGPGARQGASSFTDTDGNYWIFGGFGHDFTGNAGYLNDIWKYDLNSKEWTWVDGQTSTDKEVPSYNNSLSFDGVDDNVVLDSNPLEYAQPFTIELWFKTNSGGVLISSSPADMVSVSQGWSLNIVGGNVIQIRKFYSDVIASFNTKNLTDNQWHHLGFTFNPGDNLFVNESISMFIDGNIIGSQNVNFRNQLDPNDNHLTLIGASHGNGNESYFNGQLDEIRFWDYIRNAAEIKSSSTIELSGNESGLSAYYNFNQGTAGSFGNTETTLIDIANDVNGTLSDNIYRPAVFIGEMANTRIWSYALDDNEVKAASQTDVTGIETNLEMAFDFNLGTPGGDNTGETVLPDLVGVNDGFFANFGLTGESSNLVENVLKVSPQIYFSENDGRAVVTADLNDDSYDDVITANFDPQSINVFINDQSGNLNTPVTIAVGSYARELTVGFWNDDLFPDIAVAVGGVTLGDEKVRIFFGDGAGGFSSTSDIPFPSNSEPNEVRAADINGDTYEDLIVLLGGEDRIEIHYGDGLGAFPSSYSFDLIGEHYNKGLLIEDFTNDGFLDIATTVFYEGGCPEVGFHENDQTGEFLPGTYYPISGCLYLTEILGEDFNNDGNMDIIYYDGNFIGSFMGNGDGTFKEGADLYREHTDHFITGFTLTDINSDNITDMVITADNQVLLYEGDGTGKFEKSSQVNINFATQDIVSSDLDKNGYVDFIISHGWDRVAVVKREGDYFERATTSRTLNFDGTDDLINIPNLKVFDANFTFEGWIKTEDNGPLFSFGDQNEATEWEGVSGQFSIAIKEKRLTFMGNGFPDIQTYDEYNLTNGEWHHVAVVVFINSDPGENDGVRFYIDGIENGTFFDYDFNEEIDNANGSFFAKLGYASSDFKNYLGTTGISPESNWVEGVTFPESNSGRAYAAEWSDGENFYVFGGQGIEGIYNSLLSYSVAPNECPDLSGLTYTYSSINAYADYGPIGDQAGVGTIQSGSSDGSYTYTDISFGILQGGYGAGDGTGPELNSLCKGPFYSGSDQYGIQYTIVSQISRSMDGTSITFTWNNDYFTGMGATTTITLDAGVWPEFETESWELLSGSDIPNDVGDYGTLNISDPNNIPPARWIVDGTLDSDGNFWVFGGAASETPTTWFNDLWVYNTAINEWTWKGGSQSLDQLPIYGTQGVPDPANIPGARENHLIWSDELGNLWLFGGYGLDINGTVGHLNDLWKYAIADAQWTWVGGSDEANQGGTHGVLGVATSGSYPGARASALQWTNSNGIVWIFGGQGYDKFGVSVEYLNDLWSYNPSTNQWIWHSGSDFANSTGSYNETGLSSTAYVPGARWHGTNWIDSEDNLYLFGGYLFNQTTTGRYNDFWKYQPVTKEWTWLSGVNSTTEITDIGTYGNIQTGSKPFPGARHGGLTWTDPAGDFWMLGGALSGSNNGMLNDLWKYEPEKDEWNYIRGSTKMILNEGVYGARGIGSPTNEPRSRWHGSSWIGDDGRLWFFGGLNINTSINNTAWLNDMWVYDPASDIYTWITGSSEINGDAVYGLKGQASAAHVPGARSSSAQWKDDEGNFWLFGGYESFEYNNDLWKFNPNTLQWSWVSGNNFQNTPGTYGELGVPDPSNEIGARRYTEAMVAKDGGIWIFGGQGIDDEGQLGYLNDLWKYDPTTNIWTWMGGNTKRNLIGNYGTKGVAHPDNLPPSRYAHTTWVDDSGNLWVMGGLGIFGDDNQTSSQTWLNDLWKYDIKTNLWTWIGGSDSNEILAPVFGTQDVFDENNIIRARERIQKFEKTDKSFFLFGGRQGSGSSYNDFWEIKFTPGSVEIEEPSTILQNGFTFSYDEAWTREFRLQVALSDDFSDPFYDENNTEKSVVLNNLNPGAYYYYRMDAINEIGNSGFGATQQVLTLPATPTFESLESALSDLTSTQVYLDWEVTEGILDGYYMDVSQDPTFLNTSMIHENFNSKLVPEVQRQEILNLNPGTRYYARLQSYNASGVSPFSQVVNFLTKPATVIYPEDVVTEVTQTSAVVNWEPVPEIISNYRITVSTLDDGFIDETQFLENYNRRNVAKDKSSITVSGLDPGTSYYAIVSAVNTSGESEQPLKITILTAPSSPVFDVETSILSITQNEATFSWEAPQGFFEGYRLEISTDFSFANTNLMLAGYGRGGIPFELGQSELTITVDELSPGLTYFARIRAFNSAGVSPNSNILTITTVPRAPTLNDANNISQVGASINWQATPGTALYLIDLNESSDFAEETALYTDFPLAVPFQIFENLTPGTRYYSRVQSNNVSGSSGDMNPPDYGYTNFITIPANPVLDGVDEYTQTSFTLSWPSVEGANAYEVDVSENFFQTFLIGYNATTITDPQIQVSNLDQGSDYQIRVRAKNESGKSENAGIFDLLTLPGTPTARDATNSSASVFTANWDPSAGADYYTLEVSSDNFNSFHYNEQLTSSNPIQITNLVAGATYKYRVKAGNVSGESPYSGTITVVAQNTSQSLSISSLTFNEKFGETATSALINVKFTGGLGNPTVTIRHKEILSNNWSEYKAMTEISSTEFEFTILSNMLDDIGVAFEISADDGVTFIQQKNNTIKRTFTETNSESLPALNLGEWSMVSIPYVLDDNLVTSIFNELGDLTYKKRWRLMTYLDGEYQDQGVGFTRVDLGRGYWFNSLNDVKINVGAGETNSTVPFELALNQGWNQIGNPYNVPINWDNILDDNSLPVSISRLVIYNPTIKEFIESNTLAPFSGAFVFADLEAIVSVNPSAGSTSGRIGNPEDEFVDGNWKKSIKLNAGTQPKEIAAVGMHTDGSMSKDRFDKLVIPRFENYLEMYTRDDSYFYPKFTNDIKSHQDEYVWNFDLESNHVSGYVSLEWDPETLENGKIWLVDEDAGRIIEMDKQNSYSFNFGDKRQFSIHYSTNPDYVVTPSRLSLGDAYPNPVNSIAYIPVSLPKSDHPYELRLDLFDIQGKLVQTIVKGSFDSGLHIFELNVERNSVLNDGIYFYKVSFENGGLKDQQKKILIKH